MKYLLYIFLLPIALAAPALAREQSLLARVTVYWASGGGGSDACTRAHKCSTGARLRAGHCAVDPKKIPYGSKVIFPDTTCVAVDTGRDVINRKAARLCGRTSEQRSALVIDRFFETKSQALRWAKVNPHFMTVRVVSPNEQLAEAKKSPDAAMATKGQLAFQLMLPRASTVTVSATAAVSPNKLLADNARSSSLPRRL
jgi:3D (Asp-Asp-Asp) domain-containing protein